MDQDLQKREEYKMESNIISNNWKELIKPNKLIFKVMMINLSQQ